MKQTAAFRKNQAKAARLELVIQLDLRRKSVRKIRTEVMARLGLRSYAVGTVESDIKDALKELQERRLDSGEAALNTELACIDEACDQLWEQWELSKERSQQMLGNPAYIAEIRQQQMERRKLLGLYQPDKTVVKTESDMSREEIEAELTRLVALKQK
jgi:ATP-dependent 26S proteasome regulatory subunit